MRKVICTKGRFEGLIGMADCSILGYLLYKNIMFYPDSQVVYRVCLSPDSYKFIN